MKHLTRMQSLRATANMLAEQHNVRVVFSAGAHPHVRGNTIHLPILPVDAPEALYEATHGFISHEVCHIIWTDQSVYEAALKESRTLMNWLNIVEDYRIELLGEERYPGFQFDLRKTYEWLYGSVKEKWDELTLGKQLLFAVALRKKYPRTNFFDSFIAEEVREPALRIVEIIHNWKPLESTPDSLECARKIMELLEEVPGSMDGEPEPGTGEGGEPSDLMNELFELVAEAIAQAVQEYINQEVAAPDKSRPYLPATLDNDEIEGPDAPLSIAANKKWHEAKVATEAIAGALTGRVTNVLRTMTRSRWVGGQQTGRLDVRALHRAGSDPNATHVFRDRQPGMKLDVAVALGIDHSGSMGGSRIELATQAALVMGDLLTTVHVPFVCYGHSTGNRVASNADPAVHSRWNSLWIHQYAAFDTPWTVAKANLVQAPDNIRQNTLDGEALAWGVQQLLYRKESRKVLFWFNDGEPYPGMGHTGSCQQHLLDMVGRATKMGVEVIAFGIQTDAVAQYFPDHVVIHQVEDLLSEPLTRLYEILRKGMVQQRRGA